MFTTATMRVWRPYSHAATFKKTKARSLFRKLTYFFDARTQLKDESNVASDKFLKDKAKYGNKTKPSILDNVLSFINIPYKLKYLFPHGKKSNR